MAGWIAEDIAAGKTMAKAPLPGWVTDGRQGVHGPQGSFSAADGTMHARSTLPVYARQLFPELVLGEKPADQGTTVFEDEGVRLWHQGDGIAIVSIKSKMHSLGSEVLAGLNRAIDEAESELRRARDLARARPSPSARTSRPRSNPSRRASSTSSRRWWRSSSRPRSASSTASCPTVAAVEGMALGGGCEFVMHSQRVVAALESYIGLVEVGVGLLPAGGGLKELAQRANAWAKGGDAFPELGRLFRQVAMADVSRSAEHARELGYLKPSDVVVFHPAELLLRRQAAGARHGRVGPAPAARARRASPSRDPPASPRSR